MGAGQSKIRGVVVKQSRFPSRRRVAGNTISRETGRHMVRINGHIVVCLMTGKAIARSAFEAIGMAGRTIGCAVGAGQRKHLVMYEIARTPSG